MSEPKLGTNNSTLQKYLPILLALAVVLGIWGGLRMQNDVFFKRVKRKAGSNEVQKSVYQGRVDEILSYIDAKYVESVDDSSIVDLALNNVLQNLDPHSAYIPSTDVKIQNEILEGDFNGVGCETNFYNDTATVVNVFLESPAEQNQIVAGDKILAVNEFSAIGKNNRWLQNWLHGETESLVKLKIQSYNGAVRELSVKKEKITIHSIPAAYNIDNETMYVKLAHFNKNTTNDFIQTVDKLSEKKKKNLILDLRNNPGGYLEKAIDILSQIFPDKDKLMLFTEGRTVHHKEYKSTGRQFFPINKVAILINNGTASAAEIVAGAVQDYDRGIIIGQRSFGKGLVQEPYILRDGSELRLSVARYYTPSGRCIQRPYRGKSRKEYISEGKSDSLFNAALTQRTQFSFDNPDTVIFHTANGRIVKAGGGIRPDIEIKAETITPNPDFNSVKPLCAVFAKQYFDKINTDPQISKISNLTEFIHNVSISAPVFTNFLSFSEKTLHKKLDFSISERVELIKLIEAHCAALKFGANAFYSYLNNESPEMAESMNFFKSDAPLK